MDFFEIKSNMKGHLLLTLIQFHVPRTCIGKGTFDKVSGELLANVIGARQLGPQFMQHFTAVAWIGPPTCSEPACTLPCCSRHLSNTQRTQNAWVCISGPPAVSYASWMGRNFCLQTIQNFAWNKASGCYLELQFMCYVSPFTCQTVPGPGRWHRQQTEEHPNC